MHSCAVKVRTAAVKAITTTKVITARVTMAGLKAKEKAKASGHLKLPTQAHLKVKENLKVTKTMRVKALAKLKHNVTVTYAVQAVTPLSTEPIGIAIERRASEPDVSSANSFGSSLTRKL